MVGGGGGDELLRPCPPPYKRRLKFRSFPDYIISFQQIAFKLGQFTDFKVAGGTLGSLLCIYFKRTMRQSNLVPRSHSG